MSELRNLMLIYGNVHNYIEAHNFGYWHRFVLGVNMTYIDCNFNTSLDLLSNKKFYMKALPTDVSII